MYKFKDMRLHYATEIASWKYDGYMKDIYMKPYFDNYNELTGEMKGPLKCDGFAVFKDNDLFGLFEFYLQEDGIEIGLAINPLFVGKGYSTEFIGAGLEFLKDYYKYNKKYVYLAVEKENYAAHKAYLKFGFIEYETNREEIKMRYNLKEM